MTDSGESNSRPATAAEIAAYERGEQERWLCPACARTVEVLSALVVWCADCRARRSRMVEMVRTR